MHTPFILRDATSDDTNFIFSSFLKSFHQHSNHKFVPNTIYFKGQSEIITFLLGTAKAVVACWPEDPEELFGYVLYEYFADNLVLHYIYVKTSQRHKCVARDIIDSINPTNNNLIIATHCPEDFEKMKWAIPGKRFIFDPFFITNRRLQNHA